MAETNQTTRVLAISDSGPTQQQITSALNAQPEFELVEILASTERLAREIGAAEPDIILIDHQIGDQPTLDVIDDLAMQFPEAAMIAILPDDDPMRIQQVNLAGARSFLIQPFTQINLLSTIRRVRDLEARRMRIQPVGGHEESEAKRPLQSVTVFSPRGGVGVSTLALNLALSMYEQIGGRVLLMEGKLYFGHLDVMLNIRSQNSVEDLIPHANALDEGLVEDVVFKHNSGIHVLLGPRNLQVAQGIRPDDIYSIYSSLQRIYDFIVVDAGSTLSENVVTLMDSSDKVLCITTPDLASMHDISQFLTLSRSLAYPSEKLLVVLNRDGMPGGVRANDVEAALHHQIFTQIPDDAARVERSLNRGVPLLLSYARSPVSQAVKGLTQNLTQMSAISTNGHKPAVARRPSNEALLASSRLG
jgi:pilus assembly protein CpaE